MMRYTLKACKPGDLKKEDVVEFTYDRPGENGPLRVGLIWETSSENITVFTYNLTGGSAFRSYRIEAISSLSKMEPVDDDKGRKRRRRS